VTGCAAQTDPDGFAAMAEVDHVLGNAEKMRPGGLGAPGAGFHRHHRTVRVGDIMSVRETRRI
jgi:threonylcarbamoyladenosine tRNA methylthiotransferase MtaB